MEESEEKYDPIKVLQSRRMTRGLVKRNLQVRNFSNVRESKLNFTQRFRASRQS